MKTFAFVWGLPAVLCIASSLHLNLYLFSPTPSASNKSFSTLSLSSGFGGKYLKYVSPVSSVVEVESSTVSPPPLQTPCKSHSYDLVVARATSTERRVVPGHIHPTQH